MALVIRVEPDRYVRIIHNGEKEGLLAGPDGRVVDRPLLRFQPPEYMKPIPYDGGADSDDIDSAVRVFEGAFFVPWLRKVAAT